MQIERQKTFLQEKIKFKNSILSDDPVIIKLVIGILTSSAMTAYFANAAYQCVYNGHNQSMRKMCIDLPKYTNHRILGETSPKASVEIYMLSIGISALSLFALISVLINYKISKRL